MQPIKNIKLATINCGLKYKNRDDLLLVQMPINTAVAGVFTQSSMAAAPVKFCQANLKAASANKEARALIVNAGNANAFTGELGELAAAKIASQVAEMLDCDSNQVFISSTGVIGERLKDELIIAALPALVGQLENSASQSSQAWQNAAKAIMTTDTFAKTASRKIIINGKEVIINGFAKGSGMIAPNMATMLGYIFTNANITADILQNLLSHINEKTFNSITVDSDTSTNDTVLIFATKQANHSEINSLDHPDLLIFKNALEDLMLDLAKKIVIDGEGASKLIEIEVLRAKTSKAAKIIALAIANSPLVKTAIAGCDPNWGRIIMAIGKSEQEVSQEKLAIKIGEFSIVENGKLVQNYDEKPVHHYLQGKEIKIIIDMNLSQENQGSAKVWTCDFTEGYIKINKDYRS